MRDMWRSDDGGATWTLVTSDTGWNSTRDGQSSVVLTDGTIIMTGGATYSAGATSDVWQYAEVAPSSSCVITSATSGDVYNIGGISGESTRNIIFTVWENTGYGGRGVE